MTPTVHKTTGNKHTFCHRVINTCVRRGCVQKCPSYGRVRYRVEGGCINNFKKWKLGSAFTPNVQLLSTRPESTLSLPALPLQGKAATPPAHSIKPDMLILKCRWADNSFHLLVSGWNTGKNSIWASNPHYANVQLWEPISPHVAPAGQYKWRHYVEGPPGPHAVAVTLISTEIVGAG